MNSVRMLLVACFLCLATCAALGQPRHVTVQQRTLSPDKLISLGDFYSRNNDVTDLADSYYNQAIKNAAPDSPVSGKAQYNRANYWFSKFYVLKEQFSREDHSALSAAEGQYYNFISNFAKQTNTVSLLSDAEFYLALVYLQQGKRDYAVGWLNRMMAEAVKADDTVYVYRVVWSSKSNDIIDRKVDAGQLAEYARHVIDKGSDVNTVIVEIKRWCQRQ
jgi:tetratricopeptide (TPR) repeat protein